MNLFMYHIDYVSDELAHVARESLEESTGYVYLAWKSHSSFDDSSFNVDRRSWENYKLYTNNWLINEHFEIYETTTNV